MKRTTITLPDQLAALVDRERRRRDVSGATVIREAVEQFFFGRRRDLSFVGIVDSGGVGPHADQDEEFLAAHWADDIARDRDDFEESDLESAEQRSA
jgi:hypothetical protein